MVQWAIAYGAGALVLLEIADFLAEAFGWPMLTLRLITVGVVFAFLGVLVIAWYHGEQGHQRVRTSELLLLGAITLAGGSAAWWVWTKTPVEAAGPAAEAAGSGDDELLLAAMRPDDERTGVAILPFVQFGDDTEGRAFADGITEDITAELAGAEGLRVISRTSVMQYRDTEKSIPEIGRELGVDVILEGSVRRAGDEVRIVAQLIDARTDEHLWSGSYDRDIKDILQVQADVARDIAAQISDRLGVDAGLTAAADRPEVDPVAFEQVVEGRELAESEQPEERQRGVEMMLDAVTRDSNLLVLALPSLTDAMAPHPDPLVAPEPPSPPDPAMAAAVQRAMRHAPNAPAARNFAIRQSLANAEFEEAEAMARRAIEENPNNAQAQHYYGLLMARRGDYDRALAHIRRAARLDPRSPGIGTDLGETLHAAGRPGDAIEQLRKVLEQHPQHLPARVALGLAYQAAGQGEEAIAQLRIAAEQSGGNPMVMGSLGYVFAAQGAVEEATAVLDTLQVRLPDGQGIRSVAIAQVLSGLGRVHQAVEVLERSQASGELTRFQFRWLELDPQMKKIFADSLAATMRGLAPRRR